YEQTIIESSKRFLGGLDAEIGRMVNTPDDFENRFAAPAGGYFHVDMLPTRLGMNRPARGLGGYDTPLARPYPARGGHPPRRGRQRLAREARRPARPLQKRRIQVSDIIEAFGFDVSSNTDVFIFCAIFTFAVVTIIWVIGLFQGNHSMMDGYYGFGYA